jgi:hypothetical protein
MNYGSCHRRETHCAQNPEPYQGESVVLAGDSLPVGHVRRIYISRTGAKAGGLPRFFTYAFNEWVTPEVGKMLRWFAAEVRNAGLRQRSQD